MTLPAWLLLHFGIGVSATWLARRYALRRALLDQPGERRSHASPTPRGGGISIVVALLVAAALLWAQTPSGWWLPLFAVGLALVAGIGLVDDHRPLSPWLRLAVHAVAAGCLAAASWMGRRLRWRLCPPSHPPWETSLRSCSTAAFAAARTS